MRQRLALLTVVTAALAGGVLGIPVSASAEPTQPVIYMAGDPIYPGVIYTGSIGNVEGTAR